jgi:hypothetical protein
MLGPTCNNLKIGWKSLRKPSLTAQYLIEMQQATAHSLAIAYSVVLLFKLTLSTFYVSYFHSMHVAGSHFGHGKIKENRF